MVLSRSRFFVTPLYLFVGVNLWGGRVVDLFLVRDRGPSGPKFRVSTVSVKVLTFSERDTGVKYWTLYSVTLGGVPLDLWFCRVQHPTEVGTT